MGIDNGHACIMDIFLACHIKDIYLQCLWHQWSCQDLAWPSSVTRLMTSPKSRWREGGGGPWTEKALSQAPLVALLV